MTPGFELAEGGGFGGDWKGRFPPMMMVVLWRGEFA